MPTSLILTSNVILAENHRTVKGCGDADIALHEFSEPGM
jgi:hypothetical protein